MRLKKKVNIFHGRCVSFNIVNVNVNVNFSVNANVDLIFNVNVNVNINFNFNVNVSVNVNVIVKVFKVYCLIGLVELIRGLISLMGV